MFKQIITFHKPCTADQELKQQQRMNRGVKGKVTATYYGSVLLPEIIKFLCMDEIVDSATLQTIRPVRLPLKVRD